MMNFPMSRGTQNKIEIFPVFPVSGQSEVRISRNRENPNYSEYSDWPETEFSKFATFSGNARLFTRFSSTTIHTSECVHAKAPRSRQKLKNKAENPFVGAIIAEKLSLHSSS